MGPPHEEILALKRRREQNRLAQRRRRDNVRRRLRDLGLDTNSPLSPSPMSKDRTVTLNSHQSARSTNSLSFEIPIADTDMSPYDASLKSLVRLDSQIPLTEVSLPAYALSFSSSAGPLSGSTSASQRTYDDSTDPTWVQTFYDTSLPTISFDGSNTPPREAQIPITDDNNLPRASNLRSMRSSLNDTSPRACTLPSSTDGDQMSSPGLPSYQVPQHCRTPFPPQVHPRWTTALHMAVSRGNFAVMRLLLGHGADPNAVNSEGATALHVGVINGNYTMVAELLQRGADPTLTNAAGWLPLHLAVHAGDEGCVRVLLEADQPVDYPISNFEYP
ncbi:Ankyrin domain protein [Aspergillus nomiae NRRL 13137]|uniref:Ankyrin domain protein n=1 Tax=Aspergillus nomiae NRRL (strain ATCC 15546 / NRRL 13137 / CBS 260.88 / M93) TaxID=1509407 RepID=A0A0L1J389_ASPN3|nr:Ankyrin domain protein [Aspergillus nomiae NRRL 13137]KNG86219.1 Ankyrin domain protein [Aspergillus nomiae NRRL 13137]